MSGWVGQDISALISAGRVNVWLSPFTKILKALLKYLSQLILTLYVPRTLQHPFCIYYPYHLLLLSLDIRAKIRVIIAK